MNIQKTKIAISILILLLSPISSLATGACEVETKATIAICQSQEAQKQIELIEGAISTASGEAAVKALNSKLGKHQAALKTQQTECSAAIKKSEGVQAAQQKEAEALIAKGTELVAEGDLMTTAPDVVTIELGFTLMKAGRAQKEIGMERLISAQKCMAINNTQKNTFLAGIGASLMKALNVLAIISQIAAALGINLFGDDENPSDLDQTVVKNDTCAGISGPDLIICGGGTPERQAGLGTVGTANSSFSGNPLPTGVNAASESGSDQALAAKTESSPNFGGGGSGGGSGFGGGNAAGGGAEEAGVAAAAVTAGAGGGFFGGGGGGGGGASGGAKGSFDRFGLRSRLKKAKTPAQKKKIMAAFNKKNQLKGKGRGLASTGKDGKAGPFQDNFMVIRKAHKENYRSLFQK